LFTPEILDDLRERANALAKRAATPAS
jgi:hypothetical protein